MAINTTTIDQIPVVETELTGDESILIQQEPNAKTMGRKTVNDLVSFMASGQNGTATASYSGSQTNDVMYIAGGEYARNNIGFDKLYDKDGQEVASTSSIDTEAYTGVYETKTTEQLYIHFSAAFKNSVPLGSKIKIQVYMFTNANGNPQWFTICSSLFQSNNGQVGAHIVVDGGMKLRGCISLGNTKTVSKTLEDVISFEIVSMSSESFGSYDNVKTLYTSINKSNRILTSDVVSYHKGYILDIYAHGKIDSAINLSTMIQIGEEEFYKYGKTVPYTKNTYLGDFHVGKFVFDEKTTVKPIYNFSGIKNGGWIEIKYLCDLSTLPTVATMDEYLSGVDNMILELSDNFEIKNIIFNDNVYELSTKIETTLSNDVIHTEYALFDTTNAVDDMKGLKKIYIYI